MVTSLKVRAAEIRERLKYKRLCCTVTSWLFVINCIIKYKLISYRLSMMHYMLTSTPEISSSPVLCSGTHSIRRSWAILCVSTRYSLLFICRSRASFSRVLICSFDKVSATDVSFSLLSSYFSLISLNRAMLSCLLVTPQSVRCIWGFSFNSSVNSSSLALLVSSSFDEPLLNKIGSKCNAVARSRIKGDGGIKIRSILKVSFEGFLYDCYKSTNYRFVLDREVTLVNLNVFY